MWTEEKLDELLAAPSAELIKDIKKLKGDIIVLGAGGKMGPSLCLQAKRALEAADMNNKVIAVSRFSDPIASKLLTDNGIELIPSNLLKEGAVNELPDVPNVIYMAGKKFGTNGQEAQTWAMNAWLPSRVAEKFKNSRITVFSTGNVYPQLPLSSGGATEEVHPQPIGEYAMSSLARERMFEYAAQTYDTKIAIFRLNYSVDLRYGVLYDISNSILHNEPISLAVPCFNCIWQGDATEIAIRSLFHADSNIFRINVTGPETASVKETALKLGKLLDKDPIFTGEDSGLALLNNSGKMFKLFGYPTVPLETLIEWQAEWIKNGGRALGKPTHFEERKGNY